MIPYEGHMIVVKDNKSSEHYSSICKPTWENAGIKVNIFKAITPATMPKFKYKFNTYNTNAKYTTKNLKAKISDTEKACFYSHAECWQQSAILNKPIIIMEHDAFLETPENLWHDDYFGIIFYDKAAMGSYLIYPWFAKILSEHFFISKHISSGPYAFISEFGQLKKLKDKIVNDRHKKYNPASNQVMSSKFGNTVSHYCNENPQHWPASAFHEFKYLD